MSANRSWLLVCPDWGGSDSVWRNPLPFALWPVCGRPVISYWLDEALLQNVATIHVRADDRPHLVRAWLSRGDYWSRKIEVISGSSPAPDIDQTFLMDVLPGMRNPAPVTSGAGQLERWYSLHETALMRREGTSLSIDRLVAPNVWAAPASVIDPTARLAGPCWIGPHARIGPGCVLGPGAYVGARSVLEEDVEVVESVVCDDTFVGRHTQLHRSAAQGGLLLNWSRGVAVRIVEDFILADLAGRPGRPGWVERIAALALRMLAWPVARLTNRPGSASGGEVVCGDGETFSLWTWPRGPLLARREQWLMAVAAGRMRLLGVLPRTRKCWDDLPVELRAMLEKAPAGVLSLADLYDCHDPSEPDEWMHAAYQVGAPDGVGSRRLRKAALALAWKQPLKS